MVAQNSIATLYSRDVAKLSPRHLYSQVLFFMLLAPLLFFNDCLQLTSLDASVKKLTWNRALSETSSHNSFISANLVFVIMTLWSIKKTAVRAWRCAWCVFQAPLRAVWSVIPDDYHLYVWLSLIAFSLLVLLIAKCFSRSVCGQRRPPRPAHVSLLDRVVCNCVMVEGMLETGICFEFLTLL